MNRLNDPNPGDRASRLKLSAMHAGDLDTEESLALEASMDAADRAYLLELDAARAQTPALDLEALRAAAAAEPQTTNIPEPANSPKLWRTLAPLLILAAVLVLGLVPVLTSVTEPTGVGSTRLKGGGLLVYQLHTDNALRAYEGNPLGEGDSIGFRVNAGEHNSVVILSVDGRGAVTVFYPEGGSDPMALEGTGETTPLPGTIVLDGAPGPEIFVAVFDADVGAAKASLTDTWTNGGARAVLDWAEQREDVDAVPVERK